MTAAGDSVEEPGAVDHLIALGYHDPLDEAARHAGELRAEATELKHAQAWLEAGQCSRAIELLQQLATAAPSRTAPRRLLAQAYFRANRLIEASEILRSLDLDGVEDAEFALLRAAIASQQRRFVEAIRQGEYALCLRRALPGAELVIGEAYRRTGDLAAAETAFQRAGEHESARAAACLGLAAVSQRRGDDQRAVEQLLAALQLDMQLWAGHYRLGLSLIRLGRPTEARIALETCLHLRSALAGPWRFLAQIFSDNNDPEAADGCRNRGRQVVRQRRAARS
jgi:predicted Zn-dependent protease